MSVSKLRRFLRCGAFLALLVGSFAVSGLAIPEDAPILISEPDSTRALVTGTLMRRPVGGAYPAGSVINVYATNIELLPGEDFRAFRADIQDERYYRYPLQVLSVVPMPAKPWVYTIQLRINPQAGLAGDVLLRLTWRGMASNRVRLAVGKPGGDIKDDPDSIATPMPDKPVEREGSLNNVSSLPWAGDRVRFMQQATFGPTAVLENRLRRISYSTWLEEQMEERRDANGDLKFSTFPYPSVPLMPTVPPGDCNGTSGQNDPIDPDNLCFKNRYTMFPLQTWFYKEALYGEDQQLRRRVSWALHQIFVVGGRETVQSGRMLEYIKVLDRNAFGNYRNLLKEITVNPAMGNYLDMAISTKQSPNENYAREILQLFSIGVVELNQDGTPRLNQSGNTVATYDQNLINQFTKVFTGWGFCNNASCPNAQPGIVNYKDPLIPNQANHDTTSKFLFGGTVLPAGQSAEADLEQALDNIFYHPNVAPFMSKLLIQQLVTSNPTPAYVGRVAAKFNNNGVGVRGDLKAVIKAILLDPEARGNLKTDPDYGKLREPVLYVTNLLRPFEPVAQANAPASCSGRSDGVLNIITTTLDQDVYTPPTVFNYYPMDYLIPNTDLSGPEFGIFSTGTALKRPNFANQMTPPAATGNAATGIPVNNTVANANYAPCGTRINVDRLQATAQADPSNAMLLDTLNRELMGGSMSAGMRSSILNALQAITISDGGLKRARTGYYLTVTSPQYQVQR